MLSSKKIEEDILPLLKKQQEKVKMTNDVIKMIATAILPKDIDFEAAILSDKWHSYQI